MFQFTKAKFNHSRPLNEPKMMVDGKEYAKHQRDLKDSKVACIEQLSLCYLSIPIFQTCLPWEDIWQVSFNKNVKHVSGSKAGERLA